MLSQNAFRMASWAEDIEGAGAGTDAADGTAVVDMAGGSPSCTETTAFGETTAMLPPLKSL